MSQFAPVWSVGLMTGTVLDGNIDVALIRTDGVRVFDTGPYTLAPYSPALNSLLQETLQLAQQWQFSGPEPELFAQAETELTLAQSDAVAELLRQHGISHDDVAIVGFHGQTVLHRSPQAGVAGRSRQLGDGRLMAARLGIPVAFDFRSADMAAGGQGAPLSAIYHTALLRELDDPAASAVLNLGGVANISWWDGRDELLAFDTGPANAPLNDFVRHCGRGEMDRDGRLAAAGRVDENRLRDLLQHPYLSKPYPKSLDRFDFSRDMAAGMSVEDGAALLCAFTAAAIAAALELLPQRPARLIVCGGGRHNPTLMQVIAERAGVSVLAAEALGWRGDATEAECFAFLAVRTLRALPISFPSTTGVAEPLCGGRLATV